MNKFNMKNLFRNVEPVYRDAKVLIQHCEMIRKLKERGEDYTGNLIALLQYLKYCSQYNDEVSRRDKITIISFLETTFSLTDVYEYLFKED